MRIILALCAALAATPALAADCGGTFANFVKQMKAEAATLGHSAKAIDGFFSNVAQDPATLKADRAQGIFRWDFIEFAKRVISGYRMQNGQQFARDLDSLFDRIEAEYGVSRGVLIAFWALETDFGQVQGDFNTLNSLMTLAHDCRRPELFQPQVFSALEMYEHGDFDTGTTGAWAGEIGMVQMLPGDIIEFGRDGDGDGHVLLKSSRADALMSGAAMLRGMGWRANEHWLQEVVLPKGGLEWSETGIERSKSVQDWANAGIAPREGKFKGAANMPVSILLPVGKDGPAFMAYPNFQVFFEWNQSFTYVLTAAYFATRLEGASVFTADGYQPGLDSDQMKSLQQKLTNRGYDVGKADGILGAGTRAAVRAEQLRLGLPADSWPTVDLLNRL